MTALIIILCIVTYLIVGAVIAGIALRYDRKKSAAKQIFKHNEEYFVLVGWPFLGIVLLAIYIFQYPIVALGYIVKRISGTHKES